MRISSYWWNPRWQERHTLRTELNASACREAIDRNVGFFTQVAFDWLWPGRRWRFFKYASFVGRSARTWAFLSVAPVRDGSEVTVQLALHPVEIAGTLFYVVIYGVIVFGALLQMGTGLANGSWHMTLRDDLIGLAIFVAAPLVVVGLYLSLRFTARKDDPFMLRFFEQILQAHEVMDGASRQEPSPR